MRVGRKSALHFKNPHLLHQALTHTSKTGKLSENYERLEFWETVCLAFRLRRWFIRFFRTSRKENLSQRFMALVCKETVAENGA